MRSPFIISFHDLISEQEKQVEYLKSLLETKRGQGLHNLDGIHRRIYLADRIRQLLIRYKKDNQLDLYEENQLLNQR